MCMLCNSKDESVLVRLEMDEPTELRICKHCLEISKSYYLTVCRNCETPSWTLASITDHALKGKRFSFIYVDTCIACHGHNFHKV